MTITEITKVGKGFRYKIYADDAFVGIFEAEVLARHGLKTGQEFTQEEFEKIRLENGDYACFDMALKALEHGMKTEKALFENLQKKGYPTSSIEKAVEKVREYGYLDDGAYAQSYIKTYSRSKGKRKLKAELLNKGVPPEIVEEKLAQLDEEEQEESCRHSAEKYMRGRENDMATRQKLYRHLVTKGYDFALISKVVGEVKDDWD